MYNVRVKYFYDSVQVQHFGVPVSSFRDDFDTFSGEIFEHESGELIENPFTGEAERVKVLPDDEKEPERDYSLESRKRSVNIIYDIARANFWDWFLTFTFSPEFLDRYNYVECSRKLSQWLNNMKKRGNSDMRYLVVPEMHKDGAFHFHGLFANCDGMNFVESGKRDKHSRIIYNVGRYNWGFTTATRVSDSGSSAGYLCKYVTKELIGVTFGKKRYWASRNCARPEIEDLYITDDLMEWLGSVGADVKYIKQVQTPYNRVTYVEV